MPNKQRALYSDWKMVFEALVEKLQISEDEIYLVGGSLGGCFLLKYFSEEQPKLKINEIHLMAACISEGDFTAPTNYDFLASLGDKVHIWHAEDDDIVPFAVGEELSKHLPETVTHFIPKEKGYGHFHTLETLPELEEILSSK
jgi:predicted alpha/beta hydrolase family esterase